MPGGAGTGARAPGWAERPLVGRGALLGELETAAGDVASGTGSIVLLSGEAGIGKTTVARALAQRSPADIAVSWGTCVADGSAPPFWPWRPLLDAVPSEPGPWTDEAAGAGRFERLTALRGELRAKALERPRLHVIEDLQWADVASILLLVHLAASVLDDPMLVVATLRDGEARSPHVDAAIEELRRMATERHLAPLTTEEVAELLRAGGDNDDTELVALVERRTGGNPLFVTELLRALPMSGTPERRLAAVADAVPSRVTELAAHRLARLPDPVADALITASVVGVEGEVSLLAATLGTSEEPLLELLDQARAAHLLDAAPPGQWRFRHHLTRDAVYDAVTDVERARRHARVLESLAAEGTTPPPVIAHHALAALPLLDADRAVALAARAGEWAFAQHAYEEAVTWFERALAAAPNSTGPRWRAELLLLTGEARRHMGELGAAREAFLEAARLTDDPLLLARAVLGYASPGADLGIAYRPDDLVAADLLARAIAAQPPDDSAVTVQLEARLASELYFSDEPGRARQLADQALARAWRLDDPAPLAVASAVVHDAFVVGRADLDEQLAGSACLLGWAQSSGSTAALLTAHRARAMDLLAAGDLAAMDAEILAFRRLAEPLGAPGYLWWPALWSAMRALLDGRHDVAEERAIAAFQLGEGPFPTLAFMNLSFLLFFLRREQGRLAEMEQATREYAASHADIPALRVSLTFLLAELGRIDEARSTMASFDEAAIEALHDRNWPASWFQLARAASIVGDRRLAGTLLEPRNRPTERCVQVSLATACMGATDLAAAWLFQTTGDLDAADAHFRTAEELNARLGARSWLAQTRADHARLLLERGGPGDRAAADRLYERACQDAREIGLATVLETEPHAPAPDTAPTPTFRREGAVWQIAFADRTAQLADARGLRDLAYLLARPGIAVSVLELVGEASDGAPTRGAPALDERARREIRARLQQLDEDEADAEAAADGERAALVREERQALAEAVAHDFGLRGRTRLIGDPVERARKTVSTRIRRTIVAVGRAHPELGRHLDRSIDTGTWCAYRPADPVAWRT